MQKLNRQQLAQFLPTHEAIKAFENLFDYVNETAPQISDDIFALISSIRQPGSNFTQINSRLEEIEQQQRKIRSAQQELVDRLDAMEQQQRKSRDVPQDLLNRLQNLETLIGVQ